VATIPGHLQHIGIVAGSVEGAALCYTSIVHQSEPYLGEFNHPRITLDHISLADQLAALDAGDLKTAAGLLAQSIDTLARAGADFAICPDNTTHLAVPYLPRLAIPLLHIVDVVAEEANDRHYSCVGVLGTRRTMESDLYAGPLGRYGVTAVVPDAADRAVIDAAIMNELVKGRFTEKSRDAFRSIVDKLRDLGCDAVALACTEIPILLGSRDCSIPTLDSTRLLARAAVRRALGEFTPTDGLTV
jgi:aspartate racemase